MNKKSLMGVLLAAVVTLTSTSVMAAARQNTENATRNIVKLATAKVSQGESNKALLDVNGLKTSDEKAIEIAKSYINQYMGVNMDEKIQKDALQIHVFRNNYKNVPETVEVSFDVDVTKLPKGQDITFDGKDINGYVKKLTDSLYSRPMSERYDVAMYVSDGKVAWMNAIDGVTPMRNLEFNETKAKAAAESFLKKNGLFDKVATMELDDEKNKVGIGAVTCKDANGNKICGVELYLKDYSVTNYSDFTHK